jgi:hypothetical protein
VTSLEYIPGPVRSLEVTLYCACCKQGIRTQDKSAGRTAMLHLRWEGAQPSGAVGVDGVRHLAPMWLRIGRPMTLCGKILAGESWGEGWPTCLACGAWR